MSAHERRRRFTTAHGFDLDPFQLSALDAVDAGESVLVAAPTGSGKTVVAEYAIQVALDEGSRCFYTAPIKALSNQKYNDLGGQHGFENVGLLTGDNSINPQAPVVVMTTEVLRNMIYARSDALDRLSWVILDEVHYLQDAYRGPVWEEVIIHAPVDVRLVCLSATVSNAAELADWMSTVRGPTRVVVETRRPVELVNHYLVGDRFNARLHMVELLSDGRPNPAGARFDVDPARGSRYGPGRTRRWYTPRRVEVVQELSERGLLPAITFIFSRSGCEDAVRACLEAGLVLTSERERERITELVEERLSALDDEDLAVLGFDRWLTGLQSGFAAHHAGMVPPFKETVEAAFVEGLVKAVFATETLSLGINMPARSVVIEKLSKFGGERHESLTPGQYTQLTGRAGRRGIDEVGHAVVLWSPFETFADVARLAASRSFELLSAFRPTYNMAANLVRRYGGDEAVSMLELSFAQFQSDREIVRTGRKIDERQGVLASAQAALACERGDVAEYEALLSAQDRASVEARRGDEEAVRVALSRLRPGQVIRIESGPNAGPAAIVGTAERRGGDRRLRLIGQGKHLITVGPRDFTSPPEAVGRIELPEPFVPGNRVFQKAVRNRLRSARLAEPERSRAPRRSRTTGEAAGHPVASCPDLARHLEALRNARRIEAEVARLRRRQQRRESSLAEQFERLLGLLALWGYVSDRSLTDAGDLLVRIYHESDLLVAEALRRDVLDGLDPPTLAGVVAALTYEHRSAQPPPEPWFPPGPMRERVRQLTEIARDLNAEETARRLPLTRPVEPGFCALAHAWASGDELGDVLEADIVTGGDFVRNVKQLIDLLRQIGEAAPRPETAAAARRASDALLRGIVLASSMVQAAEE